MGAYVQRYGNQLVIVMPDGQKVTALPTSNADVWLITNDSGGGGGGDFSWPYPLANVTSEYGPRGTGFHEGMDWSGGPAVTGQPIPAIGAGTVHLAATGHPGYGNYVILDHGLIDGKYYYSLYGHMNTTPAVSTGATVTKGQTLGQVGNTGNSFGAHLHMEVHRTSTPGALVWDNNNPSYSSSRTAMNPRSFMTSYGDGGVIIP